MTVYYVGPGGNDGNAGTSWALRKLTLNGAEDIPVAADDWVWVGPGVYREQLTTDVAGAVGQPITYVADVTGEYTDGIGGVVRITGSDDDQTITRDYNIRFTGEDYRVFRGFTLDAADNANIFIDGDNNIIEDCTFIGNTDYSHYNIWIFKSTPTNITIRRCAFMGGSWGLVIRAPADTAASNLIVENCSFIGGAHAFYIADVSDVVIRNCLMYGQEDYGIYVSSLNAGDNIDVYNCILVTCRTGMRATALGEIIEDYNSFISNNIDRNAVAAGANSVAYLWLPEPPVLYSGAGQLSGFRFPWYFGDLSEWSELRAIAGANERTEDLNGIVRPVTAAKNSWGAHQFRDTERDTATTHEASAASIVLNDAARYQMWVPCDATATTISVYVYREANYAGNLPQMIVKQPGQADTTVTDVGAAGGWNLLTTTLTPAALPEYILVELVSRNTAAAGNFATYFDDLVVA